ncbi:hypothetical protein [Ancylobacter pratisalsi]|uniref:Uncharacterized protein n=1 Tax=Ancylobacter pratisalsi TaxID=1745854 RepID=A0A6P1YQH7_9HYPH|nr:hypothetical protein [Ancylobacter pratisalsi]QIB33984.1 hypothetical protein G3A50_09870 [Ancylobacter pratisalsi]
MKKRSVAWLLAGLLVFGTNGGVLAQTANGSADGGGLSPDAKALAQEPTLLLGPSQPAPQTGELEPPPGPPPEGKAADIKLPDCVPGKCGTPAIMAP